MLHAYLVASTSHWTKSTKNQIEEDSKNRTKQKTKQQTQVVRFTENAQALASKQYSWPKHSVWIATCVCILMLSCCFPFFSQCGFVCLCVYISNGIKCYFFPPENDKVNTNDAYQTIKVEFKWHKSKLTIGWISGKSFFSHRYRLSFPFYAKHFQSLLILPLTIPYIYSKNHSITQ